MNTIELPSDEPKKHIFTSIKQGNKSKILKYFFFLLHFLLCRNLSAFPKVYPSISYFLLEAKSISPSLVCAPISTSISDLFANQTPSVPSSPTCQEQLPDALLTTLLTTLLHLPWPVARCFHWAVIASESHRLPVQTPKSKVEIRWAQEKTSEVRDQEKQRRS